LVPEAAPEDFGLGATGDGAASSGFGCHSGTGPQIIFIGNQEALNDASWKMP
jgi:hypothetical protein